MVTAYPRVQQAARALRDDLAPHDAAAIALVRRQFGPLLRLVHASAASAMQEQRRRQFAQAWASLALEGMAVDLAQWAIHEQVILGVLDHDAAGDALRALHERPH